MPRPRIAGMADEARKLYGVQFHPEVTHTLQGKAILERFVRVICGLDADWTMPSYIDEAVRPHPLECRIRRGDPRAVRRGGLGRGRRA